MKSLIGKNMAPLIHSWATTDTPYTYDSTQIRCILCTYDSLYDYDGDGYTRSITSSTTVAATFPGAAGFTHNGGMIEDPAGGDEQDAAGFGMSLYGYRYYKPELGRWINRDPIGERGGLFSLGNRIYLAFSNNSIDYRDYCVCCR